MMMMRSSPYSTNVPASQIHPQHHNTKQGAGGFVDPLWNGHGGGGGGHLPLHQHQQLQQGQQVMMPKGKQHAVVGGSSSSVAAAAAQPSLKLLPKTAPRTAPGRRLPSSSSSGGGGGGGQRPPSATSPTTTSRFSFSFSQQQRMKQRKTRKPGIRRNRRVASSCSFLKDKDINWHKDIAYACHTNNWDRLLSNLKLCSSQLAAQRIETATNNHMVTKPRKGGVAGTSRAWIRRKIIKRNNNSNDDIANLGLLLQDEQGRTPLHAALACRDKNTRLPTCPPAVIMYLVQLDSMACRIRNDKGRLPLHIAVLYKHSIEIVSNLVETYPHAIAARDVKGENPLSYAIDMALKNSSYNLKRRNSPKSYWMPPSSNATLPHQTHPPLSEEHEVVQQQQYALAQQQEDLQTQQYLIQWQEEQTDRWATVHWLLKSVLTATTASGSTSGGSNHAAREEFDLNALSALISGGGTGAAGGGSEGVDAHNNNATTKPLLMEALLHAAPPDLIQLLIYMSSNVLRIINNTVDVNNDGGINIRQQQRASAIAGSTLYSCIARHYPLGVLQSLALSCPSDVKTVRDETGMGLVSAMFVSGIFVQSNTIQGCTDEWTINPQLLGCVQESIATGGAANNILFDYNDNNNIAFIDWWQKIEFLICYCCNDPNLIRYYYQNDHNQHNQQQQGYYEQEQQQYPDVLVQLPSHYLLHCSLRNPDIPPLVLRLLCTLYYESITLPDPVDNTAFTIHLAAQTQEYIPRNYEFQIMSGETNACGILLQYCPELAYCRDSRGRLPIHIAIDSGKTYKSLEVFLMNYEEEDDSFTASDGDGDHGCMLNSSKSTLGGDHRNPLSLLEKRDPITGLYPFQQAASYSIQTAQDGYRWSCVARNKYSHAVWIGLTDRQKASAILKVAEFENVSRLDTVYQLLRTRPGVIRASASSSVGGSREGNIEPVPPATATIASTSAPKPMALSDRDTEGEIIKDDSEAPEEASDPAPSETKEDSEEAAGLGRDSSVEGDDDDDNSSGYNSEENNHNYLSGQMAPTRKAPKSTPSLTNFFAREEERSLQESEHTGEEEEEHDDILGRDVYECDASVISGLDVMSLVSGVAGKKSQRGVGARRGSANNRQIEEEERSINITDLFGNTDNTDDGDGDDESSSDGETSQGGNSDSTEHRSNASSLRHGSSRHHGSGFMSYNDVEDDESEEESDGGLVYFQMRRKCKKDQRVGGHVMPGHMKNVRISKAPGADERKSPTKTGSTPAERGPIRKDSLRAMLMKSSHGKVIPTNSDHASVHSNASSMDDSYCSLKPEELGKLHSSSNMLWVSNKLHESGLLGHHSSLQNSEDDFLASFGSMRMAASSGRAKNRFDSSMDSSMNSSARLQASRSSLETSSSMDSSINSSATPQASKSSLLSGSSIASDASTNIDLLESDASLNMSYYSGDNTNSYSTFAHGTITSKGTSSYSTFAQGTISSMGTSSFSTFANESPAPSFNSGIINTSASPFAHGNARGADMPWGTSNNKYSKFGLGASLHDDSSNDSEPDILNDPSIPSSQCVERRGSVASATPRLDEYLEAASVHSKMSRRSSTKSKRSNESYDNTEALQPLLVSSKPEEIESHGHEQGTQESSREVELLRSLSAPILDDLTLNDDAAGSRCTADEGSKCTLDSKYTTDESRYTTDGDSSVCQTSSVVSMSSIQSETYFDKTEMRWKKRAVAHKDEENAGTTGSSATLTSREQDATEPRASRVPTKTLASKLLSPPESPISPLKTSRESCTPTDVDMSHVTEIRNEAITNVSTKSLANKLLSPSKSSSTKVTVSNWVPETEMQQSEVTADRSATTIVSVPEKTLANKLLSPPSSPVMTCHNNMYASPKVEARKKMRTVATPTTSTTTPAYALLSSPLKRINESRPTSPCDESPKEELPKKTKKLQLPSNNNKLLGVVPLFGDHHLASSREASMRKNKAFAHAFGKKLSKTGDRRSPGPERPAKVEARPRPSSSSSSDCPKNCGRPKHLRCRICDKNSKEVLLLPCRHLTICRHCSENSMSSDPPTCPLCKKVVKDRMLVF